MPGALRMGRNLKVMGAQRERLGGVVSLQTVAGLAAISLLAAFVFVQFGSSLGATVKEQVHAEVSAEQPVESRTQARATLESGEPSGLELGESSSAAVAESSITGVDYGIVVEREGSFWRGLFGNVGAAFGAAASGLSAFGSTFAQSVFGQFLGGVVQGVVDGTWGVVKGLATLVTNPKMLWELVKHPDMILKAGWEEIKSCVTTGARGAGRCVGLVLAAVLVPTTTTALVAKYTFLARVPGLARVGRYADVAGLQPGSFLRNIPGAARATVGRYGQVAGALGRGTAQLVRHPIKTMQAGAAAIAATPHAVAAVFDNVRHPFAGRRTPTQVVRDIADEYKMSGGMRPATNGYHWSVSGNPRLRPDGDALRMLYEADVDKVRSIAAGSPDSAIGQMSAQQIDDFVLRHPPGSRYHGAFHNAEASANMFDNSIARGLSRREANFNSEVALRHDLDAFGRPNGWEARVDRTLRTGEYRQGMNLEAYRKSAANPNGLFRDPDKVAEAMTLRTTFPYDKAAQKQMIDLLQSMDPDDALYAFREGAILAEVADKGSGYMMNNIDTVLGRTLGLNGEKSMLVAAGQLPAEKLAMFHPSQSPGFLRTLGAPNPGDAAVSHAVFGREIAVNLDDAILPAWQKNVDNLATSLDDYARVYAQGGDEAAAAAAAIERYYALDGALPPSATTSATGAVAHGSHHASTEVLSESWKAELGELGELGGAEARAARHGALEGFEGAEARAAARNVEALEGAGTYGRETHR